MAKVMYIVTSLKLELASYFVYSMAKACHHMHNNAHKAVLIQATSHHVAS